MLKVTQLRNVSRGNDPASAPNHCSSPPQWQKCVQSKEGGRGRSELLGVEGGGATQEDFMEEVAAVKEEEMGKHTHPLKS